MASSETEKSCVTTGLFVITGCSGSGKSTLLEALKDTGERVVEEPGRRVVREQLRLGGDALPWNNAERFAALCTELAIADFDMQVGVLGRTLFDRGFIDVAAAARAYGFETTRDLRHALRTRRYASTVFISQPWRTLFHPDRERRHTFEDAVAEYRVLESTYADLGYRLVYLPQVAVAERVSFVLDNLAAACSSTGWPCA